MTGSGEQAGPGLWPCGDSEGSKVGLGCYYGFAIIYGYRTRLYT